jgi:DNA-binding NarL/FixJ family response regulator
MSTNATSLRTSILFIDAHDTDRTQFIEGLKHCSPDYVIFEATNVGSGLELYQSQRIDCVVLELDLPGRSGFEVLLNLIPLPRRPQVSVIILTRLTHRGLWELAGSNGAVAGLFKPHTSPEDLHHAIQCAIAQVGTLRKEDRH